MNTRFSAIRAVALAFLASAMAATLHAADIRVYVQFAPGQKGAAQAALAQAGARAHHTFDDLNAMAVSLPEQARTGLERSPAVVLVEEDPVREFLSTQQTPYGVTMVQAPQALAAGATGAGIKVGVIDSGVYAAHEDFAGIALDGEPKTTGERAWNTDVLSHGTHVVGTIAAANNTVGVVGVAPSVAIYMVKVFGDSGNWIYSSDLLSAVRAAVNNGNCKIVSMSLGGGRSSKTEEKGMNDLYDKQGVLLVAAAGNAGNNSHSYPASYSSVISVAAIDSAGLVANFSQKNSQVELAAPGVAVLSTVSYQPTSVTAAGTTYAANNIEYSVRTHATGDLVDGGLATATNTAWSGKIVLVQRGTNSFFDKVSNVQNSGGVACVIYNNVSGNFFGTLGSGNSSNIPAVSVSQADGVAMLNGALGTSATVSNVQATASGYDYFDGTSMATPHVAGVAALVWSRHGGLTNAEVRQTLRDTAKDLGAPGRDNTYGYGLVQAQAALDALAGTSTEPPPDTGNPGDGGGDTTAITIDAGPAAISTHPKNGSFEISWTTNKPGTSDVYFQDIGWYTSSTLTTDHKRSFRGSKGQTYKYQVRSVDASGNEVVSEERTITLP